MKYFIILFLFLSCNNKNNSKTSFNELHKNIDTLSILIDSTLIISNKLDSSHKRLLTLIEYTEKRDHFIMKKHENEVQYYNTTEEKYRLRANRYVDSVYKYINLIKDLTK